MATVTDKKPVLTTKLFFPFVRMIRALDGKSLVGHFQKFRELENKEDTTDEDREAAGMEMIAALIDKLPDAENETMDFLALFSGKSREEIEEQPIGDTVNMIRTLITDANFGDFFTSAAK